MKYIDAATTQTITTSVTNEKSKNLFSIIDVKNPLTTKSALFMGIYLYKSCKKDRAKACPIYIRLILDHCIKFMLIFFEILVASGMVSPAKPLCVTHRAPYRMVYCLPNGPAYNVLIKSTVYILYLIKF